MIKLCLIALLLPGAGAFAAPKKQLTSAPVKVTTKTDDALLREHRARLSEISGIKKMSGPGGVAALKPLLSDRNPLVRGEAAEAMGKTKDPAAFAELSADVKSADSNIRWGAVKGLGDFGDQKAVPLLISALGHPERNTRWKAAQALGELKDARAVDALTAAARSDKDKHVRLAAIEAMLNIGGAKAAAAAEGLRNDPDPEIKAWAAAAAEKLKLK